MSFYDKPILDSKGEEIKLGDKVRFRNSTKDETFIVEGFFTEDGAEEAHLVPPDKERMDYPLGFNASMCTIVHPDALTELEGSLSYGGNDAHIRGILGIPIDGVQRSPSVYISRTIAITKRGVLERLKSHFEETVQYGRCVENDGSHCFMTPIDDTCCPYNWDIDKILEAIDHE